MNDNIVIVTPNKSILYTNIECDLSTDELLGYLQGVIEKKFSKFKVQRIDTTEQAKILQNERNRN